MFTLSYLAVPNRGFYFQIRYHRAGSNISGLAEGKHVMCLSLSLKRIQSPLNSACLERLSMAGRSSPILGILLPKAYTEFGHV